MKNLDMANVEPSSSIYMRRIYPHDIREVELLLVTQTIKNINPEVK